MKRVSMGLVCASALMGSLAQAQMEGHAHGTDEAEKVATVEMRAVTKKGPGEPIGHVTVREHEFGLIFEPSLSGLSPGMHGFHVHENASCEPSSKNGDVTPAGAAGSHYDPDNTGHHDAPWGAGHKGDLPALYVNKNGVANQPVLAPRLGPDDLNGRALMIHAGGDNYSDDPKPLGGGGARVACGVFEED